MSRALSRRALVASAGATLLGGALAGCGRRIDASDSKGSGWSYVDDRKRTVSLRSRPERVVAFVGTAAALHDFGVTDQIKGVFGPTKLKNGDPDPQAGRLDVDRLSVIGNTWGEFEFETYANLKPQLLVTHMFLNDALWYLPDDKREKILRLAPSIGIRTANVPLTTPIERHLHLAKALGADVKSRGVVDAKARFDAAARRLTKAARGKPGLRVMAASATPELFYVSRASKYADLSYFESLGVEFVKPSKLDKDGFYQSMSWENVDRYPADLIILDSRTGNLQAGDLTRKPTWQDLPAVKAGQVAPWPSEPLFSYAGSAPLLESLVAAIEKAEKVR